MPDDFRGRVGRQAQDIGNKGLNYGYAILTSYVWNALINAGLEPYAGFFHAQRAGKPSLVLDMMEEYRAWVMDRNIIKHRDVLRDKNELTPAKKNKSSPIFIKRSPLNITIASEKYDWKVFYKDKFIIWRELSPMTRNTKPIVSGGEMAQARLYNEVLVSYNMADTRQRTKLFNRLKDISLTSIQKSVFWGHLNRAEEDSVKRLLKTYCAKTDKTFIARVKLSEQIQEL